MISDDRAPDRSKTAVAAAGLYRLDVPEACLPGVLQALAALEGHLRTLERALEDLDP